MANVFQAATSGYRDPYKTMTLKALEARATAAQQNLNTAMQPTQIANPYQGIAGMLGVVGAGLQEGRIDNAAASGRADLADAMAHIDMQNGPDAATIARISVRDPELAQHLYDQAMERRNKQDEMKFQAGEHAMDRTQRSDLQAEAEKATAANEQLRIGSSEKIAANSLEGENTRAANTITANQSLENQREGAASALSTQQAGQAQDLETIKAKAAMAQEDYKSKLAVAQGTEPISKIMTEFRAGAYGDPSSPAAINMRDAAIQAENAKGIAAQPENRYTLGAAEAAVKRHSQIIDEANASAKFMNNIRHLSEIGKTVQTGPGQALKSVLAPFANMVGIDVGDAPDLQAYKSIADKMAPNMRVVGAGASSDYDAKQFLSALPSIANLPRANQIIEATFAANDWTNQKAAEYARQAQSDGPDHITWQEADRKIAALPNPFDNFKQYMDEMRQKGVDVDGTGDPNDPLGRNKKVPQAVPTGP